MPTPLIAVDTLPIRATMLAPNSAAMPPASAPTTTVALSILLANALTPSAMVRLMPCAVSTLPIYSSQALLIS